MDEELIYEAINTLLQAEYTRLSVAFTAYNKDLVRGPVIKKAMNKIKNLGIQISAAKAVIQKEEK